MSSDDLDDLRAALRFVQRGTSALKWLIAGIIAVAIWQSSVEWRLGGLTDSAKLHGEQIAAIDRGGSTALQSRTQADRETLAAIARRLEQLEHNTSAVPGLRADMEWIKRAIERQEGRR